MNKEYWVICVEEILGDHGVDATSEQIAAIAEDIQSCAGVHGEYSAPPDRGSVSEADKLRAQLKAEQAKVFCVTCQGTGRLVQIITPNHYSDSQCWKCNGEGSIRGAA